RHPRGHRTAGRGRNRSGAPARSARVAPPGAADLDRCRPVQRAQARRDHRLSAQAGAAGRIVASLPRGGVARGVLREYGASMPGSLRVVVGEDDVLMREGISRLLEDAGHQVVGRAGDAPDLLRKALAHRPDVVVADVQMPPDRAGDGLDAAIELRRRRPETAVLILSQYYEEEYALKLIGDRAE